MKKTFAIDGQNFSDLNGFYDEIEKKLIQDPEFKMGRNLDALNNVLQGGVGKFQPGEPVTLIWKNSRKSRRDLEYPQAVEYLNTVLQKCHPQNKKRVMQKIQDAKNQKGPVLYEMLRQIMTAHPHIEFLEE